MLGQFLDYRLRLSLGIFSNSCGNSGRAAVLDCMWLEPRSHYFLVSDLLSTKYKCTEISLTPLLPQASDQELDSAVKLLFISLRLH
jgi:hypothetical protein